MGALTYREAGCLQTCAMALTVLYVLCSLDSCWHPLSSELGTYKTVGPLRAVHLSRHKWPGGLVNQDYEAVRQAARQAVTR